MQNLPFLRDEFSYFSSFGQTYPFSFKIRFKLTANIDTAP